MNTHIRQFERVLEDERRMAELQLRLPEGERGLEHVEDLESSLLVTGWLQEKSHSLAVDSSFLGRKAFGPITILISSTSLQLFLISLPMAALRNSIRASFNFLQIPGSLYQVGIQVGILQ